MTVPAVRFTPLDRIATGGGEVLKALRSDEPGFSGIEEAYFSRVDPGAIRAWKLHTEMTVNLVVPVGHVHMAVASDDGFDTFDLGPAHDYGRLTIEPGHWYGFKGGAEGGLLLNLASILHRPEEGENRPVDAFHYDW